MVAAWVVATDEERRGLNCTAGVVLGSKRTQHD